MLREAWRRLAAPPQRRPFVQGTEVKDLLRSLRGRAAAQPRRPIVTMKPKAASPCGHGHTSRAGKRADLVHRTVTLRDADRHVTDAGVGFDVVRHLTRQRHRYVTGARLGVEGAWRMRGVD